MKPIYHHRVSRSLACLLLATALLGCRGSRSATDCEALGATELTRATGTVSSTVHEGVPAQAVFAIHTVTRERGDEEEPEEGDDARAAEVRFPSPRAVVDHLRTADDERTFGAFLATLPPRIRPAYTYGAWFGALYDAIGDPAAEQHMRALESEHGVDRRWMDGPDELGVEALIAYSARVLESVDLAPFMQDLVDRSVGVGESYFGFDGSEPVIKVEGGVATVRLGRATLLIVEQESAAKEDEEHDSDSIWYWVPEPFPRTDPTERARSTD